MTDDAGQTFVAPPTLPPHGAAAGAAAHRDTDLVSAIGRELSEPLEQAHGIVQAFIRTGKISRPQLQQLSGALDAARTVAQQSQQLALLPAVPPQPAGQQLRLDILVSQALARHLPAMQRLQMQLQQQEVEPVWVALSADLLAMLLDAAIGWCTQRDHHLAVSLDPSGDPGITLLRLRLRPPAPAAPLSASQAQPERLAWHLLEALARRIGAGLQRQTVGPETVLSLGFQKLAQDAATPHVGDPFTVQDSLLASEAAVLMRQNVLLITRDADLQAEVERICETLGLALEWVATGAAAERQAAQSRPDLVLLDARNEDAGAARLQQRLLAQEPDFPWIEIAQDASSAALSRWIRDDGLTLHNLRNQLAGTLLYGLSRARPR